MHRWLARLSPLALVAASLSALPISPAAAAAAAPTLRLQGDAIGDNGVKDVLGLLFADAFDQALPDACDVAAGLQGYGVSVDTTRFCFNPSSPAFIPDLSLEGMCRAILAPAGAVLIDTAVSRTSAWTLDSGGNARGCVYPAGTSNNFKGWATAYKSALMAYRKQGFDAMQSALSACDSSVAANSCMVRDGSGQWVPDPAVFKPLAPPPMPTQAAPTAVTVTNVAAMASGAASQVFIKTDGTVAARCDTTMPSSPSSTCSPPSSVGTVARAAAGGRHMVAVRTDGSIAQWGSITVNGTTGVARPPAIADAVDVAAGDDFALALLANGTVSAWGDSSLGQTAVPAGLSQVSRIAAGRCHAVALREDGTLAAWGCSNAGQTAVGGLTGVVAVKAQGDATVAWFANGTSKIIGSAGALGTNASLPSGTAAASAAAGPYFTSGNDCQSTSSQFTASDAGTPTSISAPTALTVVQSPTDTGAWVFSWASPANGATKPGFTYEARYSDTNGRTWSDWTDVTSPVTYPKPPNGIVGRFDVRAVYKNIAGTWVPGPKAHMVVQETIVCGGNQSSDVSASIVRVDAQAPTAPAAVTWVSTSPRSLRIGIAPQPLTGVSATAADPATYTIRYSTNGTAWNSVPVRGFSAALSGLTGGTTYQVQVVAANRFGSATTSVVAKTVTDAVVPSLSASVIGSRSVTLSWKAPVLPAGSKDKVVDYRIDYTSDGGTWTTFPHKASTKTSLAVTGLRAATDYQFRVAAVATSGTGAPTAPLAVTTKTDVPLPVSALVLSLRTSTSVSATWLAPGDTGGLPITGYTVTTVPAGGIAAVEGTTAVITGLATGKAVTINVVARNSLGASAAAAGKITVIGQAAAPTATVQRLASSVVVSWKAPSNAGGGKITGYSVTRQPDGVPMVVAGTKATLSGLSRGDKVTFSVAAVTAFGVGAALTLVVSPLDVPAAPTSIAYTSKDTANWNVSWLAPSDTGGAAIKGYRVSISRDGGVTWSAPTSVTKSPYVLPKSVGAARVVKVWAYNSIGDGAPLTVAVAN